MPDVEAIRRLAEAAARLADGREDITEALHGVRASTEELSRQVAADREEYDRQLAEAKARTEKVATEAAPRTELAAHTRGTRRRIVAAVVVLLVVLGGVASTGLVLVTRAQDRAATSAQFDRLAQERVANCEISRVRTETQIALVKGQLEADRASLALLTGPNTSESTRAFAHVVFDGRIKASEEFLSKFPAAPLTCTVPRR